MCRSHHGNIVMCAGGELVPGKSPGARDVGWRTSTDVGSSVLPSGSSRTEPELRYDWIGLEPLSSPFGPGGRTLQSQTGPSACAANVPRPRFAQRLHGIGQVIQVTLQTNPEGGSNRSATRWNRTTGRRSEPVRLRLSVVSLGGILDRTLVRDPLSSRSSRVVQWGHLLDIGWR